MSDNNLHPMPAMRNASVAELANSRPGRKHQMVMMLVLRDELG